MAIGLKRGTVELAEHDPEWKLVASETIQRLGRIFGTAARDIQHVGSTSIVGIKAKPIIDIAVAVEDFGAITVLMPVLEREGWLKSVLHAVENDHLLLVAGDKVTETRTHHIHFVLDGSTKWKNYLRFRDYLNANPDAAKAYEAVKIELADRFPNDRSAYTDGKETVINEILRKAQVWSLLGKSVTVTIDRPIGAAQPDDSEIVYPLNYGHIAGEIAPDGEELTAYVLGVDNPAAAFNGKVIAIIHREDDVEDKLVVAEAAVFPEEDIAQAVRFQEQYCRNHIELWHGERGLTDLPAYPTFAKIEPLNKGWSNDKKFYTETADGRRLLLRVADVSEYDRKKTEFEMMQKVAALRIPMSQPLDFGTCEGGKKVYQLLAWCDGEDAEVALPMLSEKEQYALGLRAGEILRKIHSICAPETQEPWETRFNRKTSYKIHKYRECGLRFEGDEKVIAYIEQNRGLLENRPQCYQHGDYHVGNMIVSGDRTLAIIDWNRPDYGDPWEEFNRIVWSAAVSPFFATGQLRGYFDGEPSLKFFKLLAFYIASNTLSSVYWAIPFGKGEIDTMMKQAQDVLAWFDNMQNPVPIWYLKDFYSYSR